MELAIIAVLTLAVGVLARCLFKAHGARGALTQEHSLKVEKLLGQINQKNIYLERGSQAVEDSNRLLQATKTSLDAAGAEILALKESIRFQEEQYGKILGQKKSSEVRTGKIAEQISPFLSDYPLQPSSARFIGDPIDFVHFDADKVTFVEVKSGKSQLSKKQREIRDLIKEGKVEFVIYRVEGK